MGSVSNGIVHENRFSLGPWQLRVVHDEHRIHHASFDFSMTADASEQQLIELGSRHIAGPASAFSQRIEHFLNAYLACQSAPLPPLAESGSPFQQRVWQRLRTIPMGQKVTYGALATQLSSAAQPIGGACKRNPIALFTPCHRVVAMNGLGGFMGQQSDSSAVRCKAWLLQHESGFKHA